MPTDMFAPRTLVKVPCVRGDDVFFPPLPTIDSSALGRIGGVSVTRFLQDGLNLVQFFPRDGVWIEILEVADYPYYAIGRFGWEPYRLIAPRAHLVSILRPFNHHLLGGLGVLA